MSVVISKQYSGNFAFLIHILFELYTREVCIFKKESSLFIDILYCFCKITSKNFGIQNAHTKN